jgi:hypothetical protein
MMNHEDQLRMYIYLLENVIDTSFGECDDTAYSQFIQKDTQNKPILVVRVMVILVTTSYVEELSHFDEYDVSMAKVINVKMY